jgi:hypothetical protein
MTAPKAPSLIELLETWQRWSYQHMMRGAVAIAEANGDAERAAVLRDVRSCRRS